MCISKDISLIEIRTSTTNTLLLHACTSKTNDIGVCTLKLVSQLGHFTFPTKTNKRNHTHRLFVNEVYVCCVQDLVHMSINIPLLWCYVHDVLFCGSHLVMICGRLGMEICHLLTMNSSHFHWQLSQTMLTNTVLVFLYYFESFVFYIHTSIPVKNMIVSRKIIIIETD